MSSDTTAYAAMDSTVHIRIRGTRRQYVQRDQGRHEEHPDSGGETQYVEDEAYFVRENRLGNNLVNVDHYFSPPGDFLYSSSTEIEVDDDVEFHTGYADVEVRLELYRDELRQAAQDRAHSHEVNVLASWLWQSGSADHLDGSDTREIFLALKDAVEESPDGEWALCYDGHPEGWNEDRYYMEPVTTLEEARIYHRGGGFDAVKTHREETDD